MQCYCCSRNVGYGMSALEQSGLSQDIGGCPLLTLLAIQRMQKLAGGCRMLARLDFRYDRKGY
jgi:hypothetical protein